MNIAEELIRRKREMMYKRGTTTAGNNGQAAGISNREEEPITSAGFIRRTGNGNRTKPMNEIDVDLDI